MLTHTDDASDKNGIAVIRYILQGSQAMPFAV